MCESCLNHSSSSGIDINFSVTSTNPNTDVSIITAAYYVSIWIIMTDPSMSLWCEHSLISWRQSFTSFSCLSYQQIPQLLDTMVPGFETLQKCRYSLFWHISCTSFVGSVDHLGPISYCRSNRHSSTKRVERIKRFGGQLVPKASTPPQLAEQ